MRLDNIPASIFVRIIDEIPAFVMAFNAEGDILFYNRIAEEICGKQINDTKFVDIFHDDQRKPEDGGNKLKYDCWIDSRCYTVADFYSDLEGTSVRFLAGRDVTDVKNFLLKYNSLAMVDPMTGVFNRQVGIDFLGEMINQVKVDHEPFTVAFLDLDSLKYVNDNFGHSKGDEYILTVCETIKASMRKTDMLSRMGGDEFLIVFPQCSFSVASKIMETVSQKLGELSGKLPEGIKYRISYGVYEVEFSSQLDMEYILNYVDNKMYLMKAKHYAQDK
ncbi:MAG: sensor domain-containing diguanylate cyclase [Defluviitaleaceae bacterium]|nr:sensor domain-containing diguanylate cyclase [Defluviitaleaceae bacterium]